MSENYSPTRPPYNLHVSPPPLNDRSQKQKNCLNCQQRKLACIIFISVFSLSVAVALQAPIQCTSGIFRISTSRLSQMYLLSVTNLHVAFYFVFQLYFVPQVTKENQPERGMQDVRFKTRVFVRQPALLYSPSQFETQHHSKRLASF